MVEVVKYNKKYRKQISVLVRQFHEESLGEYGFVMEDESVKQYEKTHGKYSFVLVDNGNVIGIMCGQIAKQPMSNKTIYQELLWYVDSNHRKYGVKLIRYLEKWCLENGIDQIVMAFIHNSMSDKLYQFYQRMGYTPMETHLIKDVG